MGKIIVISGPSGSGKTTLSKKLLEMFPEYTYSVSATTRQRRDGEIEGKDYYFLTDKQFKDMIQAGQFMEYAEVFGFFYGTPAKPGIQKLKQGHTVILEIDVQSAQQVFKRFPQAVGGVDG